MRKSFYFGYNLFHNNPVQEFFKSKMQTPKLQSSHIVLPGVI